MTIRASAFVMTKDIDVLPGSIYVYDGQWFFRAQVDDGGDLQDVGIALNNDAEYAELRKPSSTLTIAPDLKIEVRVIGEILGPGMPPRASLAWSDRGGYAISMGDYFVAIDGGLVTQDVRKKHAFFAAHWGVWVIDNAGKPVSPDPVAVIGAEP
ncbi:hypothetical protein [Xanthomonas axonopodis]